MADQNPYAPPDESLRPAAAPVARPDGDAIRAAIERLNRHLSDPGNVAADRAAVGGRVRVLTWILAAITLGLAGLVAYGLTLDDRAKGFTVGFSAFIGAVFLISTIAALVSDLLMPPRDRATTPAVALGGWLRAMRQGRAGYVFAGLCPSAREETAPAPDLRPVVTPDAEYALASPGQIKGWLKSFARHGAGQVRWMKVKAAKLVSEEGDVAIVEAQLFFRSWPSWANILSLVLFLLIRFIGLIVALVLWYSLRKQITVTIEKTLIRGRDGLWYLLDGAFLAPERPGLQRARAAAQAG